MFANCLSAISPEHGLLMSLFVGGLIGSLTHCSGMCGPLVLGQIGALPEAKRGGHRSMLLPYHAGRMTTYVLLGVVFGGLVNFAALYAVPKTILSVLLLSLAAVMFLVSAVPGLVKVFPWMARLSLPVPAGLLSRLSRPFMIDPSGWRGYVLGVLLGFMPCGLVIAALMAASTAPNVLMAGLAMMMFWLGTVPVLLAISCGGGWIKKNWGSQVQVFSSMMMAANSLILFWLAAKMVI
ncbi:MAG: sulfite exporter TauE/SafE family protein [Rhodospirillales bacterium]|nr:sulfite exporter TauE/SafE family protein [Rhodospirillales bacterium]